MTELFVKGILLIGIASAVICIVMAIIEVVMLLIGRKHNDD
jgi:hypothetical protein